MATEYCNFTEKALEAWVTRTLQRLTEDPGSIPADGDVWLRDRGGPGSVPGLALRLRLRRTHGQLTTEPPRVGFYLVRKIQGRKRSLLIGDRAVFTCEMARAKARKELRDLEQGIDRREEQRTAQVARKAHTLTFRTALNEFLAAADVAEGTRKKYLLALSTTFKDCADTPMMETFTPARVQAIHKARSEQSPSRADQDFRVLRLTWNWVAATLATTEGEPTLGPNPVPLALNKKRVAGATKPKWNHVPRRETIIPAERLGDWFRALDEIRKTPGIRPVRARTCDLLECLTLMGLRRNELTSLTWDRADLTLMTLSIPGPLAKNRRPLVRPITRRVHAILQRRDAERAALGSELVFPGLHPEGPIREPRPVLREIQKRTGLDIIPHDLRRVYASAALMAGVPQVVTKRLLNHQTNQEVTEGYQVLNLQYLAEQSQRIEDMILQAPRLRETPQDRQLLDLLLTLPDTDRDRLLVELTATRQGGEVAHG